MKTSLNIGIIGPGRVAERHAVALKDVANARLWSVCGKDITKTKAFALHHQAQSDINAYNNIKKMLDDSALDAVIIATPDDLHLNHLLMAMEAGKSVLVEKPLCTSLIEPKELLDLQQKHNSTIALGYHLRWNTGLRKLANFIHQNKMGSINHMRIRWAVNFVDHAKWRINQKRRTWCCLSALGTHLMDLAKWMMTPQCGPIQEIKSFIKTIDNTYSDGTDLIIIQFKSGATAEIYCSLVCDLPFNLEIYSEKDVVVATDLAGKFEHRKIMINDEPLVFENANSYVSQLNDFVHAIREKRSPEVTLLDGLDSVRNLLAVYPLG